MSETAEKPGPLSQALRAVEAREAQEGRTSVDKKLTAAVAEGVKRQGTFNTHSQALAGRLIAEQRALIEEVAGYDAEIRALEEKRTDAMLAQSGISAALAALEHNRG